VSGSARSVLVLLVGDVAPARLHAELAERLAPGARVRVVAPTLVGPVDWLTTAEDEAHRQAEMRALEVEWLLQEDAEVEGGAGDADPVQAVEDALRSFAADAILIAGNRADPDLESALERFALPIDRLGQSTVRRRSWLYRAVRELAAGRVGATPFVLFVGVNGALLLLGLLLSLLVILVLWLIGSL